MARHLSLEWFFSEMARVYGDESYGQEIYRSNRSTIAKALDQLRVSTVLPELLTAEP